jgi:hypothetical protein
MSDPIEERLRSYYGSLPSDPPVRLETSVARALETAPERRPMDRPIWRATWRPAFGATAVGAAILIGALVFRGLGLRACPPRTGRRRCNVWGSRPLPGNGQIYCSWPASFSPCQ